MTFDEYELLSCRTVNNDLDRRESLSMAGLGIVEEAGECSGLVKKHLYHGHELDAVRLKKELGDVLWYMFRLAHEAGMSLDEVATANVEKLRARYPNGFSHEASQNRKVGDE